MYDDPQKQPVTAQNDGDWLDKELAEVHRLLGDEPAAEATVKAAPVRNFANNFGMDDYEDECDEALENELSHKRTIRNLALVAIFELAGILGIVAYWALKLL